MRNASEISQAIKLGNLFHREVMDWDRKKLTVPRSDLLAGLNLQVAKLASSYSPGFRASIEFGDVHAKMNRQFHTELAYVSVKGSECRLLFAEKLLASNDPNAALNFVAKSWVLLLVLVHALAVDPTLHGEFVFEIGDNASLGEVGFNSSHPDACLIIDPDFASTDGYLAYRTTCAMQMVEWERREAKIFWRGSTTGRRLYNPPPDGQADDLRWLDRLTLCVECSKPDLNPICDVGVAQLVQIPEPHLRERIRVAGLLKEGVPRQQFMNYRGAFDIDGNANAWSGLFSSMLGASCILKVDSRGGYRQWYYDRLKPWENYIPVNTDLSDLGAAVNWFVTHDAEAKIVATKARELAVAIDTQSALTQSADNVIQFLCRRGQP
jgi:hypothetical protein